MNVSQYYLCVSMIYTDVVPNLTALSLAEPLSIEPEPVHVPPPALPLNERLPAGATVTTPRLLTAAKPQPLQDCMVSGK